VAQREELLPPSNKERNSTVQNFVLKFLHSYTRSRTKVRVSARRPHSPARHATLTQAVADSEMEQESAK
jgi:hypothetical protein